MFLNLNGRLIENTKSGVPHDNRAFRYGYGLFETMLYRSGQIELGIYHWERLFAGMEQLSFEVPKHFTAAMLATEVQRTVKKNSMSALCRVRLQVWPGSGGLYDATSFAPHFIIECFPLAEELTQLNENGLVVGIATGLSKSTDSLANLKTCNLIIYAVAAKQAKINKWNDALICNTQGHIMESTIANIFWVKDGTIYTPPLSEGCVAGVMRRHLLTLNDKKGAKIIERPLQREYLLNADEIFLSNAIRKIKWIKQIEDHKMVTDAGQALALTL